MNEVSLLSTIFVEYRSFWNEFMTHQIFLELIGEKNLNVSNVTNTLSKKGKPIPAIVNALALNDIQKQIANKFEIPELFEMENVEAVRNLLNEKTASKSSLGKVRLFELHCDENMNSEYELSKSEIDIEQKVTKKIQRSKKPIVHWNVDFNAGASFYAYSLGKGSSIRDIYEKIYLIQPTDLEDPFYRELQELGNKLDITSVGMTNAVEVLKEIEKQNVLLIVCNAEYVPTKSTQNNHSTIHELIVEATKKGRNWNSSPGLLIVGKLNSNNLTSVDSDTIELEMDISTEDRFDSFCKQLDRFSDLRDHGSKQHKSIRIKRAKWYFGAEKNKMGLSINVRLRAFFTSNYDTHSYVDGTAGFKRLAGNLYDNLPKDIEFFQHDIQQFLANLHKLEQMRELRAFRYISTGVYWLTSSALEVLLKSDGIHTTKVPSLGEKRFKNIVHDFRIFIKESEDSSLEKNYIMSIGVKAIIQDDWKKNHSTDRLIAHHRIANYLMSLQHDKIKLTREFPYSPHWGRTRIYFLSESLRHLIRSIEDIDGQNSSNDDEEKENHNPQMKGFPKRKPEAVFSLDVFKVIEYCFNEIYYCELNGNRGGTNSRSLSTRHGNYYLAAELLELMSDNGVLASPHWALDAKFIDIYKRDVAFMQFDMGNLAEARIIFKKLNEEKRVSQNLGIRIKPSLDMALLETSNNNIDAAETHLAFAENCLNEIMSTVTQDKRSIELNLETQKRIDARRAHLHYLKKEYIEAIKIYSKLDKASLKRDVAHVYIATLGQLGTQTTGSVSSKYFDTAMDLCTRNLFQLTSLGNQHEALGFRITMGHLFRKLGLPNAAERILNQVHLDILKYGCSYRTYHAFLKESGRINLEKENYIKSYLLYFKPCLIRDLKYRNSNRVEDLLKLTKESLDGIKCQYSKVDNKEEWSEKVTESISFEKELEKFSLPGTNDDFNLDPLSSFDIELDFKIVSPLQTHEKIDQEFIWLSDVEMNL